MTHTTTTNKFSKLLGEVEILSQDNERATVKVLKTGEVKVLINKYANLQDAPFVKVSVKKQPILKISDFTTEELADARANSAREIRESQYIASLPLEQRIETRKLNARRIALS